MDGDHPVMSKEASGDIMNHTRKPLLVREDDVKAYELRTGFIGFGEFLEQSGEITILRGTNENS